MQEAVTCSHYYPDSWCLIKDSRPLKWHSTVQACSHRASQPVLHLPVPCEILIWHDACCCCFYNFLEIFFIVFNVKLLGWTELHCPGMAKWWNLFICEWQLVKTLHSNQECMHSWHRTIAHIFINSHKSSTDPVGHSCTHLLLCTLTHIHVKASVSNGAECRSTHPCQL